MTTADGDDLADTSWFKYAGAIPTCHERQFEADPFRKTQPVKYHEGIGHVVVATKTEHQTSCSVKHGLQSMTSFVFLSFFHLTRYLGWHLSPNCYFSAYRDQNISTFYFLHLQESCCLLQLFLKTHTFVFRDVHDTLKSHLNPSFQKPLAVVYLLSSGPNIHNRMLPPAIPLLWGVGSLLELQCCGFFTLYSVLQQYPGLSLSLAQISCLHCASLVISEPKYTKVSSYSNCMLSMLISHSLLPVAVTLVFSTLMHK